MLEVSIYSIQIGHIDYNWGFVSRPDNMGGACVKFRYSNNTDRVIKYLTFHFIPYNPVNDLAVDSMTGLIQKSLRIVGPIYPQSYNDMISKPLWYNETISHCICTGATIEFMDGEIIECGDLINQIEPEHHIQWNKDWIIWAIVGFIVVVFFYMILLFAQV